MRPTSLAIAVATALLVGGSTGTQAFVPPSVRPPSSSSSTTALAAANARDGSSSSSEAAPAVSRQSFLGGLLSASLGVAAAASSGAVQPALARPEGVNRPDLLPKEQTNVIDLERFLTSGQRKRIDQQLQTLQKDTGIKVRLLCQRYPDTPGLAIKDYWGVDDKTVVIVADKGPPNVKQVATRNLLNFNVGEGLKLALPPAFWNRLQSKFGSIFYLRENGEDQAIIAAVNTIDQCLRMGYCVDVPKTLSSEGVFEFFK